MVLSTNDYRHKEFIPVVEQTLNKVKLSLIKKVKMPLELTRNYYSSVLEKQISLKQTLLLLETQIAFFLGVFSVDATPLLLKGAFAAWFLWGVLKCKKAGI